MKLIADPRNPAEYFGACGFFEIAAERLETIAAKWVDDGLIIEGLSNSNFADIAKGFAHATLIQDPDWSGEDSVRPYTIANPDAGIRIPMDWWELRDGSGTSFYKCFGGRQKSTDAGQLLAACARLAATITPENLLNLEHSLSGRLGFDPRSAWNAIDTGFSPNDFGKKMSTIPTRPFAELLTAVALQRWPFQPQRNHCQYHLWERPLPISVARIRAAAGDGPAFEFARVKRGQGISSFTFSHPVPTGEEYRS